jgi:hypothetical protein
MEGGAAQRVVTSMNFDDTPAHTQVKAAGKGSYSPFVIHLNH